MQQIKCSGMAARKIEPFHIHCTRQFNSRNVGKKKSWNKLDPQFSFVEIQCNDVRKSAQLGRAAFLLSFELYDDFDKRIETVMLGGFVMLIDSPLPRNSPITTLPYRHMNYFIPKLEVKPNYPDIEILLMEDVAAPTFVVCDYDSFNDGKDPGTVFRESLMKRDGHRKWTKLTYFWIPFEWTCRDDSVQMNEFDNPPQISDEARENYFTVLEDQQVAIEEVVVEEETNDDDLSTYSSDSENMERYMELFQHV
jgi:hypothetical protein